MRIIPLSIYLILLNLFNIRAVGNSAPINKKQVTLLIGIPVDASANQKEKNEWFKGVSEQYLHFRLGANNRINIIPSETIHQTIAKEFNKSSQKNVFSYTHIGKKLNATHILQQSYEMSRDGKSVSYYAEISSLFGEEDFPSYEKKFSIQNFNMEMDSCLFWVFKNTNTPVNQKLLSRFFNMSIFTTNLNQMKTIGKIISRKYTSTPQDLKISTVALHTMIDKNPHNLLAMYITAQLYEYSQQYDGAINQFRNLIEIVQHHSSLYTDVCRNYRLSGKYNEAQNYAANAEKKGVISPSLLLEGALSLEAMGKYSIATKAFKAILLMNNTEPHALLFFAKQRNRMKDPKSAIEYANKILSINPNNGSAYLEKGKALFSLKKYEEAEKILTESAGNLIDASEPTQLIGDIHLIKKDFNKAALFYETALKNNVKDLPLTLKTVEIWEKARDYKRVFKILERAENLFPDDKTIQKKLGITYCLLGDTTNAVFHLEKFLNKGNNDVDVLFILGDLYTEKGQFDKAFFMYKHALPLSKNKAKVTFSLALLYLKKGETGAVITNLKEILKEKPNYPEAHRFLADAWFQEKSYSTAMKEYKKARLLDPKDLYIQKQIAFIYYHEKEYNASVREFQKFLSLDNKDADVYYYLSISQLHLRKSELAEKNLEKAFALKKPHSEMLFMLGKGYDISLNTKKALEYYNQCLLLDPKHANCLLTLYNIYLNDNNLSATAEICQQIYNCDSNKYSDYLAKAGLFWEKDNNLKKAHEIYSFFVKKGYENLEINLRLARIEYSKKNYKTVIGVLKKIPQTSISAKDDKFILADSYFSIKNYKEAIPWLKQIVRKDSKNKRVLKMLATAYEKAGDFENAVLTVYRLAEISVDSEQADYLFKSGELLEMSNKTLGAIDQYTTNISKYPQDLRNYTNMINMHTRLENWAAAREILEKCIKLPIQKPEHRKKLADICLKQNDKAEAIKHYEHYLESNQKDESALYQLGNLYLNRKQYPKARVLYEKAHSLNPQKINTILKLAQTHYKTKDYSKAIALLKKAEAIDSTNSKALNYLVLCYRKQNNKAGLSETLRKLVRLQPDNYSVQIELGTTLFSLEKTSEATECLEATCKRHPKKVEAHILLADIYALNGKQNGRFSHLKKALAINPENADVQISLGKFYMEQKNYETALPYIKKALAINPEHPEALYNYSRYLLLQSNIDDALTYIKHAIKNDSSNPFYLVHYAKINIALNKNNLALKTVENALLLDSTNVEILSCAGHLYKEAGKLGEAKRLLLKALSISNKCSECYSLLGDIYFDETKFSKAIGYFQRSLDITEYNEEVMMKFGRTLNISCQYELARKIFEKIYINNPKNDEAFYRLAHIYILQNNFEKTNFLISQRDSNKKTLWDHLIAGELHEAKGNLDIARISYNVALHLNDEISEAHAGNGRLDLVSGKHNDAIINFSKAIVKDPYNPYLQLDLGKAYEGIDQYSSAIEIYKETIRNFPYIPESYRQIATIKSSQKKHTEAIQIIKQGLKSIPENAGLYSLLGFEYKVIGEFNNAIKAYSSAAKNGGANHINAYLQIANIYKYDLNNENEAKKYVKKFLKKGGDKEQVEKYNLVSIKL
jgi:tetratricopeptide (TPR) repeat protein